MQRSWLIAITLSLLCCAASVYCGCSRETRDGDLVLSISLEKSEYVEDEPVVARASLTNAAGQSRRLAEPDWNYTTVSFKVRKASGEDAFPTDSIDSRSLIPKSYGWDFAPGDTRYTDYDVNHNSLLPLGDYAVSATYAVPDYLEVAWQGTMTTPELPFAVKAGSGDTASAASSFRACRSKLTDKLSLEDAMAAAKGFSALEDPAKGSVFSKYAGYFKALAYKLSGDRVAYARKLVDYVTKHASTPFYGSFALTQLGYELLDQDDYAGARAAFEKLPDGYQRRSLLAMVSRKEAAPAP